MSTLDDSHDWQPAAASTAIATAGTVLVVAALLWQVDDVLWPVALGAVGAVLFALSCWLLSRERSLSRPLASVLTLPVALGLFGSAGSVGLVLASRLFPVLDGSLFSSTVLLIAGHVGVVFGSVLALLGATLGARTVVTPAALERYGRTTFLTALVPGLFCVAVVVAVVVVQGRGPLTAALDAAGLVWGWMTAADPAGFALAGLLFTAALAVTSVLAAVVVLPVAELDEGPDARRRVNALISRLTRVAAAVIVLHLVALGLELGHTEAELAGLFGPLYGLFDFLATARPLRFALLGVAFVALGLTALGWTARSLARQADRGLTRTAGPFVGGAAITLLAVLVADRVYGALLALVLESLPPSTEADVSSMATEATALYGEELFVALLAFALVAATLCFVVVLRVALAVGSLSADAPGFSLAAAGLLLAVVAAATVGAPTWLVLGGVVCSLLVWDAGRFGATLGRELGPRAEMRDTELVHAGATVGVGLLGAVAASVLVSQAARVWTLPPPTTAVALLSLAAGLVCFAIALR